MIIAIFDGAMASSNVLRKKVASKQRVPAPMSKSLGGAVSAIESKHQSEHSRGATHVAVSSQSP
jgi:hypothetical protein